MAATQAKAQATPRQNTNDEATKEQGTDKATTKSAPDPREKIPTGDLEVHPAAAKGNEMSGTNTEPSVVQQQRDRLEEFLAKVYGNTNRPICQQLRDELEEYLDKVGTNTDPLDALPNEDDDESEY